MRFGAFFVVYRLSLGCAMRPFLPSRAVLVLQEYGKKLAC